MTKSINSKGVGFVLILLVLTVLVNIPANSQSSALPELCQQCYFDNSTPDAINACLQQYNCNVDIPVDSGVLFLMFGAVVLIFVTFRKYYTFSTN
jgi:hypothetical protein